MVGILVILGVSWLLLHFIEKESLSVFGFWPFKKSIAQLLIGLGVIFVIRFLFTFLESEIRSFEWTPNPDFQIRTALNAFWYHFKSALTEELMYRGAVLYILIKRIGAKWALWLSALVFGIYHWFSYEIFDTNFIALAYVLIITGFTGYVWAFTYYKTGSLMMPLGFHLGSNFFLAFYLPNQPYGELLYSITGFAEMNEWLQLMISLFTGLGPSICMLLAVKYMLKKKLIEEKVWSLY